MMDWLVDTAVATALLMAAVLALRRPVASHCGAGWAYALWLIVPLRVMTPPLELLSADLTDALPPFVIAGGVGEAVASLPPIGGFGQWVPLLLALWAGGAAAFVLWQLACYRGFLRSLGASLRPSHPACYDGVAVLESRAVDGPIAIGFVKPRIVVPSTSSAATRKPSSALRSSMSASTIAAATCGGTAWLCSCSRSTGSTRSLISPFALSAPTRSSPATPRSRGGRPASATIMRAPSSNPRAIPA